MKIFVVVGTLFPFDRLISLIDNWLENNKGLQVVAQIGKSTLEPKNMEYYERLDAKKFNLLFEESDLIISHSGMGVVLKALVIGKPIIIMPRKLELNEHTTDHQIATTKALEKLDYVNIAWENEDLLDFLNTPSKVKSKKTIDKYAPTEIISNLKKFINSV